MQRSVSSTCPPALYAPAYSRKLARLVLSRHRHLADFHHLRRQIHDRLAFGLGSTEEYPRLGKRRSHECAWHVPFTRAGNCPGHDFRWDSGWGQHAYIQDTGPTTKTNPRAFGPLPGRYCRNWTLCCWSFIDKIVHMHSVFVSHLVGHFDQRGHKAVKVAGQIVLDALGPARLALEHSFFRFRLPRFGRMVREQRRRRGTKFSRNVRMMATLCDYSYWRCCRMSIGGFGVAKRIMV